jgi:hypothetical protein
MDLRVLQNRRLILIIILALVFVFLVPLQFSLSTSADSMNYFIFNQLFYFEAGTGPTPHIILRWMLADYPLSLILTLASLVFALRLQQRRKDSYPRYSGCAINLALWSIPVYLLVQTIWPGTFLFFDRFTGLPIPIGLCSILFLVFVLMPSIDWYSDSVYLGTSSSDSGNKESPATEKKVSLTPKRGSVLAFLSAFLFPGIILWGFYSATILNIDYAGFLVDLQSSYIDYSSVSAVQIYYFNIQESIAGGATSLSILLCLPSLLFAWFVMRYLHGKSSRRRAILVGAVSELLPTVLTVAFVVIWFAVGLPLRTLIFPFPAAFVVGLLVMRFTPALEPRIKVVSNDDEIRVPLKTLLMLRFSRHKGTAEKPQETGIGKEKEEED